MVVVSPPGQPHISQARRGELIEVGQGGQVQEDHNGQVGVVNACVESIIHDCEQVSLTCSSLGGRPAADIQWRHGDGSMVTGEMVDLVTLMDSVSVFRTVSTLRMVPGRYISVVNTHVVCNNQLLVCAKYSMKCVV